MIYTVPFYIDHSDESNETNKENTLHMTALSPPSPQSYLWIGHQRNIWLNIETDIWRNPEGSNDVMENIGILGNRFSPGLVDLPWRWLDIIGYRTSLVYKYIDPSDSVGRLGSPSQVYEGNVCHVKSHIDIICCAICMHRISQFFIHSLCTVVDPISIQ